MRLIDADALYNKNVGLENLAMETLKVQDNTTEFQRWQTILGERTAFKHDVFDAPTVDAVHLVRCGECKYYFGGGLGMCEMIKSRLAACQRDVRWNDEFYCAYGERKDGDRDG